MPSDTVQVPRAGLPSAAPGGTARADRTNLSDSGVRATSVGVSLAQSRVTPTLLEVVLTPALIGLGGALLGAVTALIGAALADRRSVRNEENRWRRDQLAAAYEQTLRHLLRAANLRSEFTGGRGGAVLRRSHQRDWFNDLVEAQVWLRTVVRYCDSDTAGKLRGAADSLDGYVSRLVSGQRFDQKGFSIWSVLNECIKIVTDAARPSQRETMWQPSSEDDPSREFAALLAAAPKRPGAFAAASPMAADSSPDGPAPMPPDGIPPRPPMVASQIGMVDDEPVWPQPPEPRSSGGARTAEFGDGTTATNPTAG